MKRKEATDPNNPVKSQVDGPKIEKNIEPFRVDSEGKQLTTDLGIKIKIPTTH